MGLLIEDNHLVNFKSDSSTDGPLVYGYEDGWHWSKNKGSYQKGKDFFWIHLEISDTAPTTVKLHVESPNVTTDPKLNSIKQEVVTQFLLPKFEKIITERGLMYKDPKRHQSSKVEKNKTTSPFHVVLTKEQDQGSHESNIEFVNNILGAEIREVVEKFKDQLDVHF